MDESCFSFFRLRPTAAAAAETVKVMVTATAITTWICTRHPSTSDLISSHIYPTIKLQRSRS